MQGEFRALGARLGFLLCIVAVTLVLDGCAAVSKVKQKLLGGDDGAESANLEPDIARVDIEIEGTDETIADNIRAHLSVAREPCDAPQWRVERLVDKGVEEARQGLRALGFYTPSVELRLESAAECWLVVVTTVPGKRVVIASVDARLVGEVAPDADFAAHLRKLPVRVDEPLNHRTYEESKQAIANYAAEHGYLEGRFEKTEFRVDVDNLSADIELVYLPGPRYKLGTVTFTQSEFSPDLIDRLAQVESGEPYQSDEVIELNRRLSESGYFSSVDVRPRLDSVEDNTIPVDVNLLARKKHGFSAGVGATTDAGPRLRLGYENRWLNADGHRWSARTNTSLIEQSLGFEYKIPLEDPRSDWLSFQAGVQREETETALSNEVKLGVSRTTTRWGSWLETRFINYTRADFEVGRDTGISNLLVPGYSLSRTVSNHRLRPTAGYRLFAELRGAHESAGSSTSFARLFVSAGGVYGLPWGGRLLARTDLGAMAVDGFDTLPPDQRFFTGGDTTVRGYEFESLGALDEFGNIVGGRFLVVGSLEYEHPVTEKWSVAGFVDGGNAFDTARSNDGLKVGVGLGVRWHSPIGPIRLDLAHPLHDSQLLRFHIRLGPDL